MLQDLADKSYKLDEVKQDLKDKGNELDKVHQALTNKKNEVREQKQQLEIIREDADEAMQKAKFAENLIEYFKGTNSGEREPAYFEKMLDLKYENECLKRENQELKAENRTHKAPTCPPANACKTTGKDNRTFIWKNSIISSDVICS